MTTAADRRWFAAVASLETCALCGRQGEQIAHRNYGKGMGMKTEAYMTAYLCRECHSEIDSGRDLTRDERRALLDRAIINTHKRLIENGKMGLL